jgi:hypothetical protein
MSNKTKKKRVIGIKITSKEIKSISKSKMFRLLILTKALI